MMNSWTGNNTGGLYKTNRLHHGATFTEPNDDVLMPKNVNWRDKGAVTLVKGPGTVWILLIIFCCMYLTSSVRIFYFYLFYFV